jgi:hypothetical protein
MFTLITQAGARWLKIIPGGRNVTDDQNMEYAIASNEPMKGSDADSELH